MTIAHTSDQSEYGVLGYSAQSGPCSFENNYFSKKWDRDMDNCSSIGTLSNKSEECLSKNNNCDDYSSVSSVSTPDTVKMAPNVQNEPSTEGGKEENGNETEPVFRLEFKTEPPREEVEEVADESSELTMDYPSISKFDLTEVKARRREMEARKFQEELDRMAVQLADRLRKIPASSRRSYKKESIYVKDLYTLTYEDGETLESIGHFTVSKVILIRVRVLYRYNLFILSNVVAYFSNQQALQSCVHWFINCLYIFFL